MVTGQNRFRIPGFSEQITGATILRVLVIGFSLVLFLLLGVGFFGVRNIESIRRSVTQLEEEQTVTARLIDGIEGQQAALSAVFYKLARDPESIDREAILAELGQAERDIDRIVAEVKGTPEESLWRELQRSSAEFENEARRLLLVQRATTLLSRDLFHQHDRVLSIVAKLIEVSNRNTLEAQNEIRRQARQLLNSSSILLGGSLVLAFICAVFTIKMTTYLFRRMEWQASELSRVSWNLLQKQEDTARRFSHELHDELGQCLTALKVNLAALGSETSQDRERLEDCARLVTEGIGNIHQLSQLLRPTLLDDFGLDASLQWLSDSFARRTGLKVDYRSDVKGRLSDETETHLFRIAQEALTNVAKHSGASRVEVKLGAEANRVLLSIEDNGRGLPLPSETNRNGLGLIGMRARVRAMGGELMIQSASGGGLRIEAGVPVEGKEKSEEKDPHLVSG